jgi:hypothetical protein
LKKMSKIYRLNENELLLDRIERNPRVKNFLESRIAYFKKPTELPSLAKGSRVKTSYGIKKEHYNCRQFLVGVTIPESNRQHFQYLDICVNGNHLLRLIYCNKKTGQLKFNRTFGLPYNQRIWLPIPVYGAVEWKLKYTNIPEIMHNPTHIEFHFVELENSNKGCMYTFGPKWTMPNTKHGNQQFLLNYDDNACVIRFCGGIKCSKYRYSQHREN